MRVLAIALFAMLVCSPAVAQNCTGLPSANTICAGPTSGGAGTAKFRAAIGADLPLFTSTLNGAVAASGGGTANFLRADGTWQPVVTGFANPSASVGLTTVNGAATTAMRSDAAPALSQSISPTMTGNWTFNPTSSDALAINPLAASVAKGFTISQSGPTTGTNAGTVSNCSLGNAHVSYDNVCITADGISSTGAGVPYTDGLLVGVTTGGTNSTGGKSALSAFLFHSAASSPASPRDHVALVAAGLSAFGDGGTGLTSGTAKGTMFGASIQGNLQSTATNILEVAGAEVDVGIASGGSSVYRFGLSVVDNGATQGAVLDAAFEVGSASSAHWANGLLFAQIHGQSPVSTGGCLICTDGTNDTVAKGIDISAYSFSSVAFKSANFQVDGSGNLQSFAAAVLVNASQGWSWDATAGQVSINNAANQVLTSGSGWVFVHDLNDGALAEYLCSNGSCTLGTSNGTVWVASTTTPAAGKMSVAYNGSVYAIYNNAGAARLVSGALIRTRSIP